MRLHRRICALLIIMALGLTGTPPAWAAEPQEMTPETVDVVLAKADKMMDAQQFASAFNYLRTEADKNGRPPAILIRMAALAISSYITQPGDELYGLADLKRESLEEARHRTTSYKITVVMPRALLEEAIARDPDNVETYLILGWYYSVRWVDSMDDEADGNPEDARRAEEAYRKAVELDHSNWWAHFRLARKYSEGIRSFKEALVYLKKAYPENTELHEYIQQMINDGIGRKW